MAIGKVNRLIILKNFIVWEELLVPAGAIILSHKYKYLNIMLSYYENKYLLPSYLE